MVCFFGLCCSVVFSTLGGETIFRTLGGATFSTHPVGEAQLSIFVVWRPRRYLPNISKLAFAHRRPYNMGLLVAGITVHEWVLLLL
jgi:hypothetical protein